MGGPKSGILTEARAEFGINGQAWGTMDGPYSHQYDYDKHGNLISRFGWGGEIQGGGPNENSTSPSTSRP